jgi:DNA-directed RNA polymerase subunit RPC12/RpoP
MKRKCSQCGKEFTPQELDRPESRGIEAQRKAAGVEGVLFRSYRCSGCGHADLFLDVHPLPGESDENFRRRRDQLAAAAREVHGEGVGIVLVQRS